MSENATPVEITARLIALLPLIEGIEAAVDEYSPDTFAVLPTVEVRIGRVVDLSRITFKIVEETREFWLWLHVEEILGNPKNFTLNNLNDIYQFSLRFYLFFEARRRLQLDDDGGIVRNAQFFGDRGRTNLPRSQKKYRGLVFRLEVTTVHTV